MTHIDNYLDVIQEQFNARIALEDINGRFKTEWTDCFETRCHKNFENKYEKNICKADCQISSIMRSLARVSSARGQCSSATEPNRCVQSLNKAMERYRKKLDDYKRMLTLSRRRLSIFQSRGGR
jgi:hypothetical protein